MALPSSPNERSNDHYPGIDLRHVILLVHSIPMKKDVFKFKVIFYPNEQLLDIRMRWVMLSQVQAPLASCRKPLASQSQVIIADKKQ